jgi:hypothetical protein
MLLSTRSVCLFAVFSASLSAAPIVFTTSGPDPAAIQPIVDSFRAALGTLNPNVAGSFAAGRREINWDGVPDALSDPNALPANFFNSNSPRGAVFSTSGTDFLVSSTLASGVPVEFGSANAAYPAAFQTFSPQRLFTSRGSNVLDVNFFVPGTNVPAFVTAFGAVFTDVDLANTTSIQFFTPGGVSLGTFFVPAQNNGLSFLGVRFNAGEQIGRVRITSGNGQFGTTDSATNDVVVMDDFIYAEPVSTVPEPTTFIGVAGGLLALGIVKRRRG